METISGFMLLTFWLCAGVNYIMLRNMSKRQKGLLLGVTLPPEADALPEVQAIVKQYRTRLGTLCLVCAALSVPLAFVQETAIALTLWMLFFFAGLALPYLPLLRANAKLKALKKAHGWQGSGCRMVDTGASAFALPKPIGLWTLLVPLVLCLLPMALPGLPRGLMLVCGIDAACVLLLWGLGRWTFRRREDMVTEDSARNQTLLRVRRLYWDRFWRLNLWAMALLNLFLILGYRSEAAILGLSLGFTVLLLAGSLWIEFSVRRAQAALTADSGVVADEDDAWLGGIFYYNPTDKRFLGSPSESALAPPSTSAPGRANSTMPLSALCWWSALPSGPSSALWTASPSGWSSPAALRSASWPLMARAKNTAWTPTPSPMSSSGTPCRMPPAPGAPEWTTICRGISM